MTHEPDLFDIYANESIALARNTDPDTSQEAARVVGKTTASHYERLVYQALLDHGPMTTHGLVDVLKIDRVTISPRMKPLNRKGLVIDNGQREIGPAGKKCIVWEAVKKNL